MRALGRSGAADRLDPDDAGPRYEEVLDRVGPPEPGEHVAAGVLGDWYANALFWRPQTAVFVNERSLVPVLLPLAPAATVLDRFRAAFARVAAAIGEDRWEPAALHGAWSPTVAEPCQTAPDSKGDRHIL